MENPSPNEKGLWRVMVLGTALSFGLLAAIIVSMKDFVHGDASFSFSYETLVAFALGCGVGWGFWRIVRQFR